MKPSTRAVLFLLPALLLAHCGDSDEPNSSGSSSASSVSSSATIAGTPGAPLGLYITNFLMQTPGSKLSGAQTGVEAGVTLLLADRKTLSGSLLLMEQLGTTLEVDLPDYLNRSPDRQKTLDAYVNVLKQLRLNSGAEYTALTQQLDALKDELRDKRNAANKLQRDLNSALTKKDYATASDLQSQVGTAKVEQAKADAQVNQVQSIVNIFKTLNAVADQRLQAIAANREVLIAGLHVVDVPGIDDLGVLKTKNSRDLENEAGIMGGTSN